MVLIGFPAFLNPPNESAANAIRSLVAHNVSVKVLTGDNEQVARTVCAQVGIDLICPSMIVGVLFTQLDSPALRASYIALFHAGWFVESM